ncbi:uncharacterized protein LOC118755652 [Rhagoletis pomonella]|uniref:uncharacterized protein LOC118755652 n=1 Tax=Rhagoletis pomonella TaxID=28610 RepID=UPI00177F46AE|nr:uncharacterized protein LOC118755652 [Rhagoletis pomonella]
MPMKFREGKIDEPAATKTRLGLTIYGVLKYSEQNLRDDLQLHICECDDDLAIQKLLIESMKHESADIQTQPCDLKYENDKNRLAKYVECTGDHFTTKLLWRSRNISLPDNYEVAKRRLECFEKKLNQDSGFKENVIADIHGMKERQYIRKLNECEVYMDYKRKWYLPIFSVRNPNKPKKTRLIGICADICEMFHRVSADEEDQHAQRFLWRDCDDSRAPDVYVLKVMSFETSCSPSIAQYVRVKNAEESLQEFPRASKSIIERDYVDDMLDSADSPQEAIQLARNVKEVHKRACREVKIPRCYFGSFKNDDCKVELHVFVEASESASAAVAYFSILNDLGIQVALVSSKTKVAPLRAISIPRMELTAAVPGLRLVNAIVKGHDFAIHNTHFYTDSKTILTSLRSDPRKYKQFVMFRVAEIQENSDISKWHFVTTKQNAADAETKWKNSNEFAPTNPWFTGPDFLRLPHEKWPKRGQPIEIFSDNGTNLVSAENELRKAYAELDFYTLQAKLTTAECKWTFIPPASPHMGGAWERLIRSVKNVMYHIVTPDTKLTDEKLHNLLLEVESIVNGRPLTYLSLDAADQEALTPNHFFLGSSYGSKPPSKFC